MNNRRRIALLSLTTALTVLALAIGTSTLETSDSEQEARAGIEREGDIPLPFA